MAGSRLGSKLRAVFRLGLYLPWTVALMPVQALAVRFGWRLQTSLPAFYHRVCCRILGLGVEIRGTPSAAAPTLFVSNHLSYLDIEVLGSVIAGSFVAKTEVNTWPFFGALARLQRTVFVDRSKRGTADAQRDSLQSRLEAGDNLVLFPEGTSSDGNRTLPFKSALFAAAGMRIDDRPLTVQPVSIACTALDGIPLGRRLRPIYAWYGDMDLLPHLWNVVKQGHLTITVIFHPPVTLEDFRSRKSLADHCWRTIAVGVSAANAGRLPEPAAANLPDQRHAA
ncbi:1-acyl-sn-glycerol-3-phosphate acyltransferase [Inquilinus ginsengisoli]|jgi:1-acyl-sn-glycerol-3-phosphate acyltransferase|uniref:1-acyl-sn-glycerol-3-phosphate acyltransferase n=1 Tax=Inquilinus ginsengisoli TaxID=363840 RepID=A0ABU1K1S5_9PROT|nr:lysophospholipid acyltransferase family protein [Inquilinus ginsengisoli]MDR6293734.1 1-acyl-sn-glycerol-3-phosphate acyltransferase [Inquilinus ginsengisoli]